MVSVSGICVAIVMNFQVDRKYFSKNVVDLSHQTSVTPLSLVEGGFHRPVLDPIPNRKVFYPPIRQNPLPLKLVSPPRPLTVSHSQRRTRPNAPQRDIGSLESVLAEGSFRRSKDDSKGPPVGDFLPSRAR